MHQWVQAEDSYCCKEQAVDYWWVSGPGSPTNSLDHVLDLVEHELRKDGRHWTNYSLGEALGQVESLLEAAMEGRLVPVDEIVTVQRSKFFRMFELRQSIYTIHATLVGNHVVNYTDQEEPLRIYHGEDGSLPWHALGVHLHIKDTSGTPAEIKDKQNSVIDHAIDLLEAGKPSGWGLSH